MTVGDLPPVLTIDGPSGSGKGTVSRRVADALEWNLLDSGALYRALAHAAQLGGVGIGECQKLGRLAGELEVEIRRNPGGGEQVLLAGRDVTTSVRTEQCGARASEIATVPAVREGLKRLQQRFRRPPGLVADGRDMGSVIFPDARLKIFLTASVEERAERRYKQLKEQGLNANLRSLFRDIAARDQRDRTRTASPLAPAEEAVVLDTTGLGIEKVVADVMELVRLRLGHAAADV